MCCSLHPHSLPVPQSHGQTHTAPWYTASNSRHSRDGPRACFSFPHPAPRKNPPRPMLRSPALLWYLWQCAGRHFSRGSEGIHRLHRFLHKPACCRCLRRALPLPIPRLPHLRCRPLLPRGQRQAAQKTARWSGRRTRGDGFHCL